MPRPAALDAMAKKSHVHAKIYHLGVGHTMRQRPDPQTFIKPNGWHLGVRCRVHDGDSDGAPIGAKIWTPSMPDRWDAPAPFPIPFRPIFAAQSGKRLKKSTRNIIARLAQRATSAMSTYENQQGGYP